jgi:hypothetical protein
VVNEVAGRFHWRTPGEDNDYGYLSGDHLSVCKFRSDEALQFKLVGRAMQRLAARKANRKFQSPPERVYEELHRKEVPYEELRRREVPCEELQRKEMFSVYFDSSSF